MQLHESTVRQDARTPRHQDEGWLGHGRRGDVLVAPEQACNRPQTQRRRKRRRENANEIPLTPLNTIPLPPSPAHGSHTANTLQICNERGGFPNDGVLARRPAARQQKGAVSRREPRATGRGEFFTRSRMIGTTHSKARNVCSVSARYHASSFKAIMRGVPREKARSEPVVSAPSTPRRCLSAAHLLPAAACLAAACRISFFRNFAILPTALRD